MPSLPQAVLGEGPADRRRDGTSRRPARERAPATVRARTITSIRPMIPIFRNLA